jgi:CheY-like chemotaxis protein
MNAEEISVLLVEDDPGDVMLVREAFAADKVGNTLSVVSDGVEAMRFVRGEGEYAGVERPDLVLLDLNLPRKSGAEVLAEIKSDPQLSTIPVVVLTTSQAEEDVLRSYEMHANAYVTKPVDFDRFGEIVRQIDEFFVGIVRLPVARVGAATLASTAAVDLARPAPELKRPAAGTRRRGRSRAPRPHAALPSRRGRRWRRRRCARSSR